MLLFSVVNILTAKVPLLFGCSGTFIVVPVCLSWKINCRRGGGFSWVVIFCLILPLAHFHLPSRSLTHLYCPLQLILYFTAVPLNALKVEME